MKVYTMIAEKLIRINQLSKDFSIPKSTIWHWVKTGQFPKPIKLGLRFTVWRESDLLAWIDAKQKANNTI